MLQHFPIVPPGELWLKQLSYDWCWPLSFPIRSCVPLWSCLLCGQHCGKAIKPQSFFLFSLQISRLINNSSFFFLAAINMTQTPLLSLCDIIFLLLWLEWTPVFQRSACIDCTNVSLISKRASTSFPCLVPLNMPGTVSKKHLKMVWPCCCSVGS